MHTSIALIRGINVGGKNSLPMKQLIALCEALDLKNVRTYVQSGNVLFDSSGKDEEKLAVMIEKKISRESGLTVSVLVRSADEMRKAASDNPFLKRKGIDLTKLHVTFLSCVPAEEAVGALAGKQFQGDEFIAQGREIYLFCPGGYGKTKLTNNFFEAKLGAKATTRNWNTVNQLVKLAGLNS